LPNARSFCLLQQNTLLLNAVCVEGKVALVQLNAVGVEGKAALVQLLLDNGADVNAVSVRCRLVRILIF
jgi:hypothetical protein